MRACVCKCVCVCQCVCVCVCVCIVCGFGYALCIHLCVVSLQSPKRKPASPGRSGNAGCSSAPNGRDLDATLEYPAAPADEEEEDAALNGPPKAVRARSFSLSVHSYVPSYVNLSSDRHASKFLKVFQTCCVLMSVLSCLVSGVMRGQRCYATVPANGGRTGGGALALFTFQSESPQDSRRVALRVRGRRRRRTG